MRPFCDSYENQSRSKSAYYGKGRSDNFKPEGIPMFLSLSAKKKYFNVYPQDSEHRDDEGTQRLPYAIGMALIFFLTMGLGVGFLIGVMFAHAGIFTLK